MSYLKLSVLVIAFMLTLSSISTFASFNSDYKDFVLEIVQHVPAKSSFDPNVVSGSLMASYETTQNEKMSVNAIINFVGQLDKTSKNVAINLSASGSYVTESGTQFIDTAGQSIIVPDQWGFSKFYVLIDRLNSNVIQLQDTTIQSVVNKLMNNRYVWTGESSDSLWVSKTLSKWSFIPSVAWNDLNSQIKFYQQIINYPIITPTASQWTNWIYNIKLNKKNTAQIMTLIATSQNPKMTVSDKNQIKRDYIRSIASAQSQWTFDPANNRIQLTLKNKWSITLVDLMPQSLNLSAKNKTSSAIAKITWDRDLISFDTNGSQDATTFQAYMMANQGHVEISWWYKDEFNKWTLKLLIDTASTGVIVSEPKNALPIGDLQL